MEAERWRRVEELYHSTLRVAVDQRAAFLRDACRGDTKLCEEIASLLAYESSAKEFMEMPAFEVAAKLMAGDEASENQADPVAIGVTLQRFRVVEKLGRGGMGVVYKAEDTRLLRTVALKFLPKRLARDPLSLERFEREAHAASALNHPNICTVYDIGEYEGQPFIAMELLKGQTLDRRVGRQPLSIEELLSFGIQITEGLYAAHQKGIIHRDIKPANIFVTSEGQAKILDFGLAKLAPAVATMGVDSERNHREEGASETSREREQRPTPDPLLSRTGVAMGTAGYMSPEQARGEKLDARTDLFSFGLVLYEMATGKRAFQGDTGPELYNAILGQVPASARKMNPSIPAKLEPIINRALQKDREARYQSAAELRTDLESLQQDLLPKPHALRWLAAAAGLLVLFLVSAVVWIKKHPPSTLPDLKLQQLTINSSENSVTGGSISPDGKYLAYTDNKGMHVKRIETDETQSVPQPEGLKINNVTWEIVSAAWFPDSARFIANAHPASESQGAWSSQTTSIWLVSLRGGVPQKIRDNAIAWSVSPDGSFISFGANKGKLGEREIWLMAPSGQQARKLFDTDENGTIGAALWSPDGQRMIYSRTDDSGDTLVSRDLKSRALTTLLHPSDLKNVTDLAWLPDGRLMYAIREPQAVGDTCNYWTLRVDARTGKTIEQPRRLTNWSGFCLYSTSVTKDGKRLAFQEWTNHGTSYMADLEEGGTRIFNPIHFTLNEGDDAVSDWSADSKAVIVVQNRRDHYTVYKQFLNAETQETLVTASGGLLESAQLSPDGKWVIMQVYPVPGSLSTPRPVLRVPITGGSSELIFTVPRWSGSTCARAPSNLCAVAQRTADGKQMVVTAFDPVKGRGFELARFDLDPEPDEDGVPLCGISPDGTRLATSPGRRGPIKIRSLRGQPVQVIRVKGLDNMRLLGWAADGKSLLVSNSTKGGAAILHVDLQGNAKVLWNCSEGGDRCDGTASPDGRHLAVYGQKLSANMWMMENF